MIRKRIEETDDEGRTVTTALEEPHDAIIQEYGPVYRGPLSSLGEMIAMLSWWVGLAGIGVFVLLAFRLGFELGDANPVNSFVDFIYDISGPLVQPFQSIASARTLNGGGIFHPETAIAMGIYIVATALVVMAMNTLAAMLVTADTGPVVNRNRMVRGH